MIRAKLQEIYELLEKNNDSLDRYHIVICNQISNALNGDDGTLWDYLTSNEFWGGSGSVADQALIDKERSEINRRFESLMIELGREQIKMRRAHFMTESWISAFEHWKKSGI